MAGFDSAPGFASFSWMSDEAYEEYEESHEHEHDDEDGEGCERCERCEGCERCERSSDANEVVALGMKATTSIVKKTVETTSIVRKKIQQTSLATTMMRATERFDTETKLIFGGIATAVALIGGKHSFSADRRAASPTVPQVTTSIVAERPKNVVKTETVAPFAQNLPAVNATSMTLRHSNALPPVVAKTAAVAGIASAAAVAAAAIGFGISRSGVDVQKVRSKLERLPSLAQPLESDGSAVRRLEVLRQSMILEFETEIEKLGAMKKEKNDNLKTLNDDFKRHMKDVQIDSLSSAGAGGQSTEELQRVLVKMKEEHETAIKANEAAFHAQEVTLKSSIERLEKALNIAEDALHEAKEVNKSMATRHEIEIRAARGLIRAERELGRSEASKYRASRDLQRMHLATLRSELALAKVTSGERLSFLEDQLKAICASYSERIVKERADFAATLSKVREPVAGLIQDSDSTTQDEFLSKIAEIRAEAEVEISSLVAKYDSAMRGAAGERRALKALLDSEMNKASPGRNIERGAPVERADPVTSVVDVSAQANDAIRDAQIQFEQRVVALKKAHNEEIERVKVSKKSQVAVSPVEMRNDVDVDAVRDEAVRGVAGERRALKSMFDSEMRKASERTLTRLQSEVAISEVSSSKKMNDAIRDAQIQFEQRVVALKLSLIHISEPTRPY